MKEPSYIKRTETESSVGDRLILCYFLTEQKGKEKSFGIGIDMYTQRYGERTVRERKTVKGIFATKNDAERFIDILCRGCVTPTTLEDIIEDRKVI